MSKGSEAAGATANRKEGQAFVREKLSEAVGHTGAAGAHLGIDVSKVNDLQNQTEKFFAKGDELAAAMDDFKDLAGFVGKLCAAISAAYEAWKTGVSPTGEAVEGIASAFKVCMNECKAIEAVAAMKPDELVANSNKHPTKYSDSLEVRTNQLAAKKRLSEMTGPAIEALDKGKCSQYMREAIDALEEKVAAKGVNTAKLLAQRKAAAGTQLGRA